MDDFAILIVLSKPREQEADFKTRLIEFWTRFLRQQPEEYKQVYAETTQFERRGECLVRQYFVEITVADMLTKALTVVQIDHEPVDADDLYSKYEATPPQWFQIPH